MATLPASTSASSRISNSDSLTQNGNSASDDMSIDQPQQQHQQTPRNQSPEKQQQQLTKQQPTQQANANVEQKRPMNAFLLFCKQQRSLVKEKHPNLENREITKILGDWWTKLDKEQKSKYTDLARQHKQAFMEANPDFKWCKTTITTTCNNNNSNSNNNNSNNNNNINNNQNNNHDGNNRQSSKESSLTPALTDLHQPSDSRDTTKVNRQQQEAPKPPKKRYLERNETLYSKINPNDTSSSGKDNIVPYLSLDQAMLGRVIEKALSEKSNDSPVGLNMCKDSNGDHSSNNWNPSMNVEPNPVTTSAIAPSSTTTTTTTSTTATTNSTSPSYSNGDDEPVDFSMKVTFRTTNQLIIDNVIEKAFSGSVDVASGTSRSGDVGSGVHSQLGPSIRRVNTEIT